MGRCQGEVRLKVGLGARSTHGQANWLWSGLATDSTASALAVVCSTAQHSSAQRSKVQSTDRLSNLSRFRLLGWSGVVHEKKGKAAQQNEAWV